MSRADRAISFGSCSMDQLEIFAVQSDDHTTHKCLLGYSTYREDSGRTPLPEQKPAEWLRLTVSSTRDLALGYVFGRNPEASIVLPAVAGVSGKQFSIKPTSRGIELIHPGTYKTRFMVGTGNAVNLEAPGDKRSILDGEKIKILELVSLGIAVSEHLTAERQLKEHFCAMLDREVVGLDNLEVCLANSTLLPCAEDGGQGRNYTNSNLKRNIVLIQGSEDTDLVDPGGLGIRRSWAGRRTCSPNNPNHRRNARKAQRGSPASGDSSARSISRPRRVRFAVNKAPTERMQGQNHEPATADCITQLDSKNLRCRLLFWPGDRELKGYSGDWMPLDRINNTAQLGPVMCLAVDQTSEEPRCRIKRPFPCRFIYHTSSDAVEFCNVSKSSVWVDSVPS